MATILQRERWSLDKSMSGIRQRITELTVVSPRSGHLTSLVDHAAEGRWVPPSEPLAIVLGDGGARLRGLVASSDISRIRPGMRARFIPNDLFQPSRTAIVTDIAAAPSPVVDQLELAESYGGSVPTRISPHRAAAPLTSQYSLIARISEDPAGPQPTSPRSPQVGLLKVHGDAESLLQRFWNRFLLVLVRESGF